MDKSYFDISEEIPISIKQSQTNCSFGKRFDKSRSSLSRKYLCSATLNEYR